MGSLLNKRRHFLFITMILVGGSGSNANAEEEIKRKVSLRFDCINDSNLAKGNTQGCLNLTGLRANILDSHKIDDRLTASLVLNPLTMPSQNMRKRPDQYTLPGRDNSLLSIVEDFQIVWKSKKNLEIIAGKHYGAATLPDVSGLSMSSQFDNSGWDQTAITVRYLLPLGELTKVDFIAGNGEGELDENLDPQQYFGFRIDSTLATGFLGSFGLSLDGNSAGSSAYEWQLSEFKKCGITVPEDKIKQGYSATRVSAGFTMDGNWASARGLKFGIGWQQSTLSDLNKDVVSFPSIKELAGCEELDLSNLFIEDPTKEKANDVTHVTIALNTSYRLIDTYTVAFDFEQRTIDFGEVEFFEPCESFIGESCQDRLPNTSVIKQSSFSTGLGIDLERDLNLLLEYNITYYDQLYNKFHYKYEGKKLSESRELFNARLSYNWK